MTWVWMRTAICVAMCALAWAACAGVETTRPAVGPQFSWEENLGTFGLVVSAPMISFGARAVAVTDVCRSGDRLRATAADGTALEIAAADHRPSYPIQVGRIVGDGENRGFRVLFVKTFAVPPRT